MYRFSTWPATISPLLSMLLSFFSQVATVSDNELENWQNMMIKLALMQSTSWWLISKYRLVFLRTCLEVRSWTLTTWIELLDVVTPQRHRQSTSLYCINVLENRRELVARVDNVDDGRFAGYELVVQAVIHYKSSAIFHVYRIPVADPEPIRAVQCVARKTKGNMKERN